MEAQDVQQLDHPQVAVAASSEHRVVAGGGVARFERYAVVDCKTQAREHKRERKVCTLVGTGTHLRL